jgi:hypothetical protein
MTKLFKPASEPEPTPLTPNREALANLNAARAAAATEVDILLARVASLSKLKESSVVLEAELASLDAAEADALAQWSVNPDDPAPEPDTAARSNVLARLQAARQRIAGAEQATASVEHLLNTANQRAAGLEREVPALVANVLIDEARSLLPSVIEAVATVARVQGRYLGLRKFLLERAEAAKDIALRSGFYQQLELLDREAGDAAALAPTLSFSGGTEWQDLARELGDVPIGPTPTLPAAFNLPETKWVND